MDDYWVWGGSCLRGPDGRYHLFASRWPKSVTFFHWATRSEIVRASADRPEGPYRFEEVVIGERGASFFEGRVAHNPSIHCINGKYLLCYVGTTYEGPTPQTPEQGSLFSPQWLEAWHGKRTALAVADSLTGPWKRPEEPVLQPRPGAWDSVIISNPAPWVHEDGRILLVYKSTNVSHSSKGFQGRFHLGAAMASSWDQPFERLSDEPIQINGDADHHLEDPVVWVEDGVYQLIAKDMTGELCGEPQAAIHAWSTDAVNWRSGPKPKAYSRRIVWDDGETEVLDKLERPKLGFDENQRPSHLFAATLRFGKRPEVLESRNIVIPLRRS